jgi:PBS lyase HEAT-like repeat
MTADKPQHVDQAIAKLKSFHGGDRGVLDAIACGERAVPALRTILFEREPSGLYQTRCRAVEALSAIGADDVLIKFLEAGDGSDDPIERLGEDAVINAAALALANTSDRHVFELLLRLAHRPALTGVIGALGAFENAAAIPALIDALDEDASRLTAEAALRKLGRSARPALIYAVDRKVPSGDRESESSARRRRSALRLLMEIDGSSQAWRDTRHLLHDKDAKVAAIACEIGVARGSASERAQAVRRLIDLLSQEDWLLREQIESNLVAHYDCARSAIASWLDDRPKMDEDTSAARGTETVLRRVVSRARTVPQPR